MPTERYRSQTSSGLDAQNIVIPLARGLNSKVDPKVLATENLVVAENCDFRILERATKRNGYTQQALNILGSSSLITTGPVLGQALMTYKQELLMAIGPKLYSLSANVPGWAPKGQCAPCIVGGKNIQRNGYSQTCPDSATVNGITLYAWVDSQGGVRASVMDDATGAYLQHNILLSATGVTVKCVGFPTGPNQTLVAVYRVAGALKSKVYTPLTNSFGSENSLETDIQNTSPSPFDVIPVGNAAVVIYGTAAAVKFFYVLSTGLAAGAGSPYPSATTLGSVPATAIAAVYDPSTLLIYVAYDTVTPALRGFVVNAQTFATFLADKALDSTGTVIRNVTGCLDPSTANRVIWFYEFTNATSYNAIVWSATLTSGGTVGTPAILKRSLGLATKAFVQGSVAYVGCVYQTTLNPTYFILDSAGNIVARMLTTIGGGLTAIDSTLPNVRQYGSAWRIPLLTLDRLVSQSGTVSYLTGVWESTLDFASINGFNNQQLADSLLMTGGYLQGYDGNSIVEAGFHYPPENVTAAGEATTAATVVASGGGAGNQVETGTVSGVSGSLMFNKTAHGLVANQPVVLTTSNTLPGGTALATTYYVLFVDANDFGLALTPGGAPLVYSTAGVGNQTVTPSQGALTTSATYGWAVMWEWQDAAGRIHRSQTQSGSVAMSTNVQILLTIPTLRVTAKTASAAIPRSETWIVVYRTAANGTTYYRDTSISAPILNDPTADSIKYVIWQADSAVAANEILYNNANVVGLAAAGTVNAGQAQATVLGNDAIPSPSLIAVGKLRVFAWCAEKPDTLFYSQKAADGLALPFSLLLSMAIPQDETKSPVMALSIMDGNVYIFRNNSIFVMGGDGPDVTGLNNTFTIPQVLASDVGCINSASVVRTSQGIYFQSAKGICLLDRGLNVTYIGSPVEQLVNAAQITAAVVVAAYNQVRWLTAAGPTLVFDYFSNQWMTFTNVMGADAVLFNGAFSYLRTGGPVWTENPATTLDNGAYTQMRIRTAWIKPSGIDGYQRTRQASIRGEYISPHNLNVRVAYDFEPYFYDQLTGISSSQVGPGDAYGTSTPYGTDPAYGGTWEGTYNWRVLLRRQKCSAVQFEFQDSPPAGSVVSDSSLSLSSLTLELGIKKGIRKGPLTQRIG